MRIIEVFDEVGSQLGLIYLDSFKRDNKAGGAWMGNGAAIQAAWHQAGHLQCRPVGSTNLEYIR